MNAVDEDREGRAIPEQGSTAERIVSAARRLIAAEGLKSATTRRVAKDAGVNEVTLFILLGETEGRPGLESAFAERIEALPERRRIAPRPHGAGQGPPPLRLREDEGE